MLASARATTKWPFECWLYLDDDDPTWDQYPPDVFTVIGPRINLGPAYEDLRKRTSADLVMMCADDLIFQTEGWDDRIRLEAHPDLVDVISFDDGSRENGHPFVGRGLIEQLGYLSYPKLGHSCIDNWIVGIARHLDRFTRTSVQIRHVHPKYKTAEWDQTYLDNSAELKKKDGDIYRENKDGMLTEAYRVKKS